MVPKLLFGTLVLLILAHSISAQEVSAAVESESAPVIQNVPEIAIDDSQDEVPVPLTGNFCDEVTEVQEPVNETSTELSMERVEIDCTNGLPGDSEVETLGNGRCSVLREVANEVYALQTRTRQITTRGCCSGWEGDDCNTPVCSALCANGGTCSGPDVCDCENTGYTGDFCQETVCDPPCLNGGECVSLNECSCLEGYSGSNCELPICNPSCQNGGQCVGPNECQCPDGRTGDDCSDEVVACEVPCEHGGVCVTGGICSCIDGWGGATCIDAICEPECVHGTCSAPNSCECSPEYQGQICDLPVDFDSGGGIFNMTDDDFLNSTVCSSCCNSHYRTFDGRVIIFPGKCTYSLVSMCDNDGESFGVDIVTDYDCDTSGNVCRYAVHIHHEGVLYTMYPGKVLHRNAVQVHVPHMEQGMSIVSLGVYLIFQGVNGVRVSFDGRAAVYVNMPTIYHGRLCGLCGNYDGDSENDLVMYPFSGSMAPSDADYGNRMKTGERGDCVDVPANQSHPCQAIETDQEHMNEARERCNHINSDIFEACHTVVDPEAYHGLCMYHMCQCDMENGEACECESFTQYSRACAQKGVVLNWRTPTFCSLSCDNGMDYSECGSACPRTCENADFDPECDEFCVDGCICPVGSLFDGQSCVSRPECPCLRSDELYPADTVLESQCRSCTCEGGVWDCDELDCDGGGSIIGDHYFKTFDGFRYKLKGNCQYTLVQSRNNLVGVVPFYIWVDMTPCALSVVSVQCIASVSLR